MVVTSVNAALQRVPVFPSTAFEAGNVELSSDDATAGCPCESSVLPPLCLVVLAQKQALS